MNPSNHGDLQSVTNRLLAMIFFGEFILIYPLVTIMYGARGHVNGAGIGIILGLGLALSVVLEIPTGIIADKVPRKYVLFVSILFKILALMAWLLLPYFKGYLLAATLFAFSAALESGTLQAYLYGALGKENKKEFGKFWSRVSAMVMISYTVAYILTSIIGVHYSLLIDLSIVPCVLALGICISLPTDSLARSASDIKPKVFSSAVNHIKQSPDLIKLIISGVVIVALAEVIIEYSPLYYQQVGVKTRLIPILLALGNLIGAALFWQLHKWDNSLNKYRILLLIFMSAIFAVSFMGGTAVAVVGVLLFTRFLRLLQVQYESSIQHLASDEARATIASIGSFVSSFLGAAILTIIGVTAINNSIVKPIRASLLIGASVYFIIQLFNKKQPANLGELEPK